MKVYGGNYAKFRIPKFRVGDVVCLKQFKETIQGGKSLDVNFTPELYIIRKVNRGIPNMHFIKSKSGNKDIPFRFYKQEFYKSSEIMSGFGDGGSSATLSTR